jgi:hypothetical protein
MAIKTFTTGEVLTASDTNTYLANSGLVLIKTQTIGSAVSSVTVSSAFSTDYDNYLIKITGGSSSVSQNTQLKLGATVSGYKWQLLYGSYNNTVSAEGSTTGTEIRYCGNGSANGMDSHIEVMSPFLAKHTKVFSNQFSGGDAGPVFALIENTTSYTSFIISPSAGTMTGATITVYGYRKA